MPTVPSVFIGCLQANSEVSALLGRIPSAVGYQPTLATDLGTLQERITTTKKGSITSVQVRSQDAPFRLYVFATARSQGQATAAACIFILEDFIQRASAWQLRGARPVMIAQ